MKQRLFYILFFICSAVFAQEYPVTITADTTEIRIGEQVELKIKVTEKENVVFPEIKLDSLSRLEIVESVPTDTLKNSLEKRYLLTSFDSGIYIVPIQEVLIDKKQYLTDPIFINVANVKVDTLKQKMFPIKSIKSEPKTFDDYKHLLWWLIPILAIIALILYYVLRKKKLLPEKIVQLAPIEEAMQRLKALDEKHLLKQQKVKIYYTELTDIVRTYIEKDTKIPALESTTNELIETMTDFNESSNLGISKATIHQLKLVLQNADLVKFAKANPVINEIRGDRTSIEEILNATELAVKEKAEAAAAAESTELEEIEVTSSKKKLPLKKILIGVAALVIIGLSITAYFGYGYLKDNVVGKTPSEMLKGNWFTATYGNPPISIEAPEVLEAQDVELPEDVRDVIEELSVYTYGSLMGDFYVALSTNSFSIEIPDLDIDGSIKGAIAEIEKNINSIVIIEEQEVLEVDNVIGRKVLATFSAESPITNEMTDYKLSIVIIPYNNAMQQLIIGHRAEDEDAVTVRDRILNSISIK